jgi:uncharacterized protein YqeY
MGLMEKISADMTQAMKGGEKLRLETLRTLRAALVERQIEKRGAAQIMTPDDELGVLMTAVKKRRESIEQFQKGARTDLVDQEQRELAIIQEYLPKQLTEEEVGAVIEEVVAQTGGTGPSDFGKVMPMVMKQLRGRADGRLVQELVRKRLGG